MAIAKNRKSDRKSVSNAAPDWSEFSPNNPEELAAAHEEGREPRHQRSLSGIAQDAAQSGVLDPPRYADREALPGAALLSARDPDVELLGSGYSDEEVPGGSMSSPDQNSVDEVGRAYGLTDEDSGALVSTEALLERRDRHRWELDPRSKDAAG